MLPAWATRFDEMAVPWYVPAVVGAAEAEPDIAAIGVTSAATPTTIPADSRAFLKRIMSCAPSY